jgi:hypothetical protein
METVGRAGASLVRRGAADGLPGGSEMLEGILVSIIVFGVVIMTVHALSSAF